MLDIEKILEEAKKKVKLSCDEYHAHSAQGGCLYGPEDAITICKLCEEIRWIRYNIEKFNQEINR